MGWNWVGYLILSQVETNWLTCCWKHLKTNRFFPNYKTFFYFLYKRSVYKPMLLINGFESPLKKRTYMALAVGHWYLAVRHAKTWRFWRGRRNGGSKMVIEIVLISDDFCRWFLDLCWYWLGLKSKFLCIPVWREWPSGMRTGQLAPFDTWGT